MTDLSIGRSIDCFLPCLFASFVPSLIDSLMADADVDDDGGDDVDVDDDDDDDDVLRPSLQTYEPC